MKTLISIIIIIFFTSCTENKSIEGHYIRIDTNIKIESIGDAVGGFGLISEITFYKEHCEFNYFGLPMSGPYEIEGNKIFINSGGQIGNLSMIILDNHYLKGTGFINGKFLEESSQDYQSYLKNVKIKQEFEKLDSEFKETEKKFKKLKKELNKK